MKIRVLGSSGSENPGHNPPAFLVDERLLFDAGTVSVSLDREAQCRISHIFLTHAHLDHIKGIPFLVDNIVASRQGCRLTVLSGTAVIMDIRQNIFNNRIWPDFTAIPDPEHPVMRYQIISPDEPIRVADYTITATEVNHAVPSYGYMIESVSGNALIYTGDTGPTERIWKRMSGHSIKALIIEVSFPNEMMDLALTSGHLTPALLEKEIAKMPVVPERLYITHLKPYHQKTIIRQLAGITGVALEVLHDGMEIFI